MLFIRRAWIHKRHIAAHDDHYDQRRKHTNGEVFENSLGRMLEARASKTLPEFVRGTLPHQYRDSVEVSTSRQQKGMGWDLWMRNFANNRERHALTFWYPLKLTTVQPTKTDRKIIVIDSESKANGMWEFADEALHFTNELYFYQSVHRNTLINTLQKTI